MPQERRQRFGRICLRSFDDLLMGAFSRMHVFKCGVHKLCQAGNRTEIIIREVWPGRMQLEKTEYLPVMCNRNRGLDGLSLRSVGRNCRGFGGCEAPGDWRFVLVNACSSCVRTACARPIGEPAVFRKRNRNAICACEKPG